MRLKIKLNLGHDLPPYKQDQVVDEADEAMAMRLVGMGLAEHLEDARAAALPAVEAAVEAMADAPPDNFEKLRRKGRSQE